MHISIQKVGDILLTFSLHDLYSSCFRFVMCVIWRRRCKNLRQWRRLNFILLFWFWHCSSFWIKFGWSVSTTSSRCSSTSSVSQSENWKLYDLFPYQLISILWRGLLRSVIRIDKKHQTCVEDLSIICNGNCKQINQ